MANSYFADESFQDALVGLLCRDRQSLQKCFGLLAAKDFRPLAGQVNGHRRWIVAQLALSYWSKYREPISTLLRAEVIDHCTRANLTERKRDEILAYVDALLARRIVGAASVLDKTVAYKRERIKADTIQQLIEEQQSGTLTDEKWLALSRKALDVAGTQRATVTDYFEEFDGRLERRGRRNANRYPLLMIEPLDTTIHAIARKELGLILGPRKRGKSTMLRWIALAYAAQSLNVLLVTLEDPKEEVEDRLDMAVTGLTGEHLRDAALRKVVQERFQRFRRMCRSRIKTVDGTGADGGLSIADIDEIIEREREQGFLPDALIVDYDDEIQPPRRRDERRLEFSEIYTAFRRLIAERNMFGWTAAQTKRETDEMQIISGSKVSEDISKINKATCAISMGKGQWGDDSLYLWVAAHRTDKMEVGCNIFTNRSRGMIYDHVRTMRRLSMGSTA